MRGRLIARLEPGRYRLVVDDDARQVIGSLGPQLSDILMSGDQQLTARLFPPAYGDDDEREAEYRRLMGDDLLARRFDDLDQLEAALERESMTAGELESFLRAVNSVRLVLSSVIGIETEEDAHEPFDLEDDDAAQRFLYEWLTGLLADGVWALELD